MGLHDEGVGQFQSTPSARRATKRVRTPEGAPANFNPRPPRGGRRASVVAALDTLEFQSTPSARRATKKAGGRVDQSRISIHALREEGDTASSWPERRKHIFQSTPSARRATLAPAKRSTAGPISIHALREEGDRSSRNTPTSRPISIHALREEGDQRRDNSERLTRDFNPRPPRGGRPSTKEVSSMAAKFQSTPSARRATRPVYRKGAKLHISIHALREEGD